MPFFDLRVCECKNLPQIGVFNMRPTPYVVVHVSNNNENSSINNSRLTEIASQQRTPTCWVGSSNPNFDHAMRFAGPGSLLHIEVFDEGTFTDTKLGQVDIDLARLPNLQCGVVLDEWFRLGGARGTPAIRLRILAHDFGAMPQQSNNNSSQYMMNNHTTTLSYEQQHAYQYPVAQPQYVGAGGNAPFAQPALVGQTLHAALPAVPPMGYAVSAASSFAPAPQVVDNKAKTVGYV